MKKNWQLFKLQMALYLIICSFLCPPPPFPTSMATDKESRDRAQFKDFKETYSPRILTSVKIPAKTIVP